MTPTLEPGVYDADEAPWFEFTCDEDPSLLVVKQWMGEAALAFAQILANRCAGGKASVEVTSTTLDGLVGHYLVTMSEHTKTTSLIVTRGDLTPKPMEPEANA